VGVRVTLRQERDILGSGPRSEPPLGWHHNSGHPLQHLLSRDTSDSTQPRSEASDALLPVMLFTNQNVAHGIVAVLAQV